MRHDFYSSKEYRQRQSFITKQNWKKGFFDFRYKRVQRLCRRKGCGSKFEVILSDPKVYCGSHCAALVNNQKRGPMPEATKAKIAQALKGKLQPIREMHLVEKQCENQECVKTFRVWPYLLPKRKFCSNQCAMEVIGGRPTSPRAARGKAGVRLDISPTIYFYSRWEANIARLYTYLGMAWQYAPRTFDLGGQKYTPDFYLPELEKYVEIKNFWWKHSKERDEKFRKLYPYIKLDVILKPQYLALEKEYAKLIPTWEHRNSVFNPLQPPSLAGERS